MIVPPTSILRYFLNETDHPKAIHVRALLFAWMFDSYDQKVQQALGQAQKSEICFFKPAEALLIKS